MFLNISPKHNPAYHQNYKYHAKHRRRDKNEPPLSAHLISAGSSVPSIPRMSRPVSFVWLSCPVSGMFFSGIHILLFLHTFILLPCFFTTSYLCQKAPDLSVSPFARANSVRAHHTSRYGTTIVASIATITSNIMIDTSLRNFLSWNFIAILLLHCLLNVLRRLLCKP